MLNTNLDSFIVPDLAFFAPLDAVGNFADEPFCIWNGLLGSAPAHPALTNVIKWMVNLVSSRGDMYDMERAVCRFSGIGKIENWKVRAEPGLMLSGPCALGLAVNNALGNEPLSGFKVGLLKREGFNGKNIEGLDSDAIGNVLFLVVSFSYDLYCKVDLFVSFFRCVLYSTCHFQLLFVQADKDDLGEFRFSDPERNIIIASTELTGLSKSPMMYEKQNVRGKKRLRQKPHYSVSTRGQQPWGTHDVYGDDIVEDEQVSFIASYK